ncbi:MAG: hypothetical protein AB7S38_29560 [Vulcanimicrobiota bacterium]
MNRRRGSSTIEFLLAVAIVALYGLGLLGVAGRAAMAEEDGRLLSVAEQMARTQIEKAVWEANQPGGFQAVDNVGFTYLDSGKRLIYSRQVTEVDNRLKQIKIRVFRSQTSSSRPLPQNEEPIFQIATLVGGP